MTVVIDFNFFLRIAQILIGVVTIFYGRRLYWLWIGFEAFLLGERLASFALYGSTDLLRFSAAALIGLLFALLALRFHRHVLTLGGFLSAGVLGLIVTGRFLPIVPGWMALAALVAVGSLGALFVWRNHDLGVIILSAVSGTLAAMTILRRFTGSGPILEALAFVSPGRPGHLVPDAPVAAQRVSCDAQKDSQLAIIPPGPAPGRMRQPASRRCPTGPDARRGCDGGAQSPPRADAETGRSYPCAGSPPRR